MAIPPDLRHDGPDSAFQPYVPRIAVARRVHAQGDRHRRRCSACCSAPRRSTSGLRAGLTVSASIPIAVLAISVLKKLGGSTILENNIVQTIGSAGESVAGGVVFTIPALIFLTPDGPRLLQLLPDRDAGASPAASSAC